MSGVRLRVDVDDEIVRRKLDELGAVRVPREVWDEIGQTLVSSTVLRFESGRGPDDMPWTPSRRATAQGGQTLVDSARLRDSITHRADADEVEVGTNVVYGAIHQLGSADDGSAPRGIPARPFLGIDDGDRREIQRIVERSVAEAMS